jgi:hypothetical protein
LIIKQIWLCDVEVDDEVDEVDEVEAEVYL